MNNKVSVIVPVYNTEKYLPACIESLINQTFTNLEIILINDGSKDNSGNICDEYAQRDNRIIVIHQKNKGVSKTRNLALSIASGDYIGFVDSDDWIEPEMFEYLVTNAIKYNADISRCGLAVDTPDTHLSNHPIKYHQPRVLSKSEALKEIVTELENASSCTKIIKADIAKSEHFDETLSYSEDWKYNYDIARKSNVFVFSDTIMYHYIKRHDSSTNNLNEDNIRSGMTVFDYFYENEKNNTELFPYVCKGYYWEVSTITIRAILVDKANTQAFKEMIKSFRKKEKQILPNLSNSKQKIRTVMMCHFMWLYKINMRIRHSKFFTNSKAVLKR